MSEALYTKYNKINERMQCALHDGYVEIKLDTNHYENRETARALMIEILSLDKSHVIIASWSEKYGFTEIMQTGDEKFDFVRENAVKYLDGTYHGGYENIILVAPGSPWYGDVVALAEKDHMYYNVWKDRFGGGVIHPDIEDFSDRLELLGTYRSYKDAKAAHPSAN